MDVQTGFRPSIHYQETFYDKDPQKVLKIKGRILAEKYTIGVMDPPIIVKKEYSNIPGLIEVVDSVIDRIIMEFPAIIYIERSDSPSSLGIVIPIIDNHGGIGSRLIHSFKGEDYVAQLMVDIAQAIYELLRRGDLTDPSIDTNKFINEIDSLTGVKFSEL